MTDAPCLQELYAPRSICFGCGPANAQGLHVRSFVEGDAIVSSWTPATHHHAFPGVLNGGIIGALLDCHCNWTAAFHLMRRAGAAAVPPTVTADYTIRLLRPTPMDGPLRLVAAPVELQDDRAVVEGRLEAGGRYAPPAEAPLSR